MENQSHFVQWESEAFVFSVIASEDEFSQCKDADRALGTIREEPCLELVDHRKVVYYGISLFRRSCYVVMKEEFHSK